MLLSRRRKFAALVLFVAVALALGSSSGFAPKAEAESSLATLTLVDGDVLLRHGDAGFSPAREGNVLAAGDTVRVGTGASAELTYFDGSSVRLEADAEVVVASLQPDGGPVVRATQAIARAWQVVGKLVSGSTRYDLRGPSASASVRG